MLVAAREELHRLRHPLRGLEQPFAPGILPDQRELLLHERRVLSDSFGVDAVFDIHAFVVELCRRGFCHFSVDPSRDKRAADGEATLAAPARRP